MVNVVRGISGTLLAAYFTAALSSQHNIKEKNQYLQQAAFLIALSKFVDEKCLSLRTNRTVLYSAITGAEIDIRETRTEDFRARVDSILEKLAKTEESSCQLAYKSYGPSGTITPRIFSLR